MENEVSLPVTGFVFSGLDTDTGNVKMLGSPNPMMGFRCQYNCLNIVTLRTLKFLPHLMVAGLGSFSGHHGCYPNSHSPLCSCFSWKGRCMCGQRGPRGGVAAGLQDTAMSCSAHLCSQELPSVISQLSG